jgi:hypothetical protein
MPSDLSATPRMRYEVREHNGTFAGLLIAECRWFTDAVKLWRAGRFIVERNRG